MRAVISGRRKGSGHSRRVGAGLRLRVRMRALISGRGGGGGGGIHLVSGHSRQVFWSSWKVIIPHHYHRSIGGEAVQDIPEV